MTLPLQIRADNLEVAYRKARRSHQPSRELWLRLRRARSGALRVDVMERKKARQGNLFKRAAA